MKESEVADGKKKPGTADSPAAAANQETIFNEQQTEQPQAADTIRSFLRDHLARLHEQIETTLGLFEGHIGSQQEADRAVFDQRGFFDFIGDRFEEELMLLGGGAGRPLAVALVREVHNAVAFAQRSSFDVGNFVHHAFRRGTRDACWYLRDAAPSLLGMRWPELLKLAADGGNQFIPALYTLGLPRADLRPAELAERLRLHAEGYRRAAQYGQQRVQEQVPEASRREEIETSAQKDMLEQGKKEQPLAL